MNLSGKIALVTGASRGIGESLAIGLADHGTDVIICDLESESKGLANTYKQIEKLFYTALMDKVCALTMVNGLYFALL